MSALAPVVPFTGKAFDLALAILRQAGLDRADAPLLAEEITSHAAEPGSSVFVAAAFILDLYGIAGMADHIAYLKRSA